MPKNYYVQNKDILVEIKKYKETDIISEELGRMILTIIKNLSRKSNFANYTWIDDMVGEAVLTCVKYLHNFNVDTSKNPFGYITMIAYHSFIAFVKKQKKHSVIKDVCFKYQKSANKSDAFFSNKGINYEDILNDN